MLLAQTERSAKRDVHSVDLGSSYECIHARWPWLAAWTCARSMLIACMRATAAMQLNYFGRDCARRDNYSNHELEQIHST